MYDHHSVMLFLALGLVAASNPFCDVCVDEVGKALEMARSGKPIEEAHQAIMKDCQDMKMMLRVPCRRTTMKFLPELYKEANSTKLTAFEICKQKTVCSNRDKPAKAKHDEL